MDTPNKQDARPTATILHMEFSTASDVPVVPSVPEERPVPLCMEDEECADPRKALDELLLLLDEQEDDPVSALSGYLISEDPTYLPEMGNARALARCIGRDRILALLISDFRRGYVVNGREE